MGTKSKHGSFAWIRLISSMNDVSLLSVKSDSLLQDGAEEQKKLLLESARKLKQASGIGWAIAFISDSDE